MWRHAAAGRLAFINPDDAVEAASRRTAPAPHADLPSRTARAIVAEIARLQHHNSSSPAALPWLAVADIPAPGEQLDRITRLELINAEIRDRVKAIGQEVVASPPAWATSLGPRPSTPEGVIRWERTLTFAAVYRETFRVPPSDITELLGRRPAGNPVQFRARAHFDESSKPHSVPATRDERGTGAQPEFQVNAALDREFNSGVHAATASNSSPQRTASKQAPPSTSHNDTDLDPGRDSLSYGRGAKFRT